MKKICMIVPSFEAKGGITAVVSGYRGSELEEQYNIRYIETYCDGGKVRKLWKAVCAYVSFLVTLVSFKPDLIHIHSSFGASFYRKAPFIYIGSALRIPVVNHMHGSEVDRFYRNAGKLKKQFIRNTVNKCRKTIVLADPWKKQFSEFVDEKTMEVIANYSVCPRGEKKEATPPQVLFLGFLSPLKGCMDIPEVAAKVREYTDSVSFVLGGSGSDENIQRINELARSCGVQNCIQLPGWISGERKDRHLRDASVFLLPSYTECMPMSVLEAMGYGLPVVSTTVGGIPQLVEHGKTGFLVEPGDTKGFAEAIVTLLKNPELRREMGEAGRARAKEHYSLENHINRLMDVYRSLAG